nr:hypothetical protein CFP56_52730 [Quercus suber]
MIEIPGRSTKRRRTIVRGEEADQTYHLHQVGVRGVESQRQATEVRGAGARVFVIAAIFVTGGLTRDAGGAGQSVSESDVEGAEGGDLAGLGDGGGGAGGTEPDDAVADAVDRALEQAVALRQERGHGHGGEEDGAEADHRESRRVLHPVVLELLDRGVFGLRRLGFGVVGHDGWEGIDCFVG